MTYDQPAAATRFQAAKDLLALLLLLAIPTFCLVMFFHWEKDALTVLFSTVAETEATLGDTYVKQHYTRGLYDSTTYDVTYTYTVDGAPHAGKCNISSEPQPIMTVQYLVSDPGRSGIGMTAHAWHFAGIYLIILSMFGLFLWLFLAKVRKVAKGE